MTGTISPDAFIARTGQSLGVSDWIAIDQGMIDAFADTTFDRQFIHVDPVAAANGPFGATVAHGFLTLSLLSPMQKTGMPVLQGLAHGINYGFNRIRFIEPVRAGSRVRAHFTLLKAQYRRERELESVVEATIEIEGRQKPALVAEWVFLSVLA